jgi:uncharacterized protein YaaW (UPF0174 family)
MRARTPARYASLLLGLGCVGLLVIGQDRGWPTAVRLPLALAVFLVVPGIAVVTALRLRLDGPMTLAAALALSVAVDLIGAELLLTLHVATVRNLLMSIGGVTLVCLLARAAWDVAAPNRGDR